MGSSHHLLARRRRADAKSKRGCASFSQAGGWDERGVALITTVIILLMLGSMGAALMGMAHSRLLSVTLEVDRLQAAYLAEAGLARALYEITKARDEFGNDGIGAIPPTGFGPGYFQVQQEPKSRTLLGLGIVRDVRRVIVNKY